MGLAEAILMMNAFRIRLPVAAANAPFDNYNPVYRLTYSGGWHDKNTGY